VERVWKWKEQHGGRILEQMKRAGMSCDWSRERFTFDEGFIRAVREVFVTLYEKGLIYQGDYIVNWCPRCRTVLSDLEVEHEETEGHLWHIRYPLNGSDLKLVVAPRGRKQCWAILRSRFIRRTSARGALRGKTCAASVDGSGDSHCARYDGRSRVRQRRGENHARARSQRFRGGQAATTWRAFKVIGGDAKMTAEAGRFAGLDRFEARKQVVEELEKLGLLEKNRAVQTERRQVSPLQNDRRAAGFEAMVDADEAAGRARDQSGGERRHQVRSRELVERRISSGCTTFATGAFRGSCGGGIAFPRGIAPIARASRWRAKRRRRARSADRKTSSRIPTFWTRGIRAACGPS
jgi:hypothetical protein